jgi:hypothetical protein
MPAIHIPCQTAIANIASNWASTGVISSSLNAYIEEIIISWQLSANPPLGGGQVDWGYGTTSTSLAVECGTVVMNQTLYDRFTITPKTPIIVPPGDFFNVLLFVSGGAGAGSFLTATVDGYTQ